MIYAVNRTEPKIIDCQIDVLLCVSKLMSKYQTRNKKATTADLFYTGGIYCTQRSVLLIIMIILQIILHSEYIYM